MKLFLFVRTFLLTLFILFISSIAIIAQSTAFTYQGRFSDSSVAQPTSGTYSMTFRLFDAATGGNQIPNNTTAVTSMVSVVNGVFTARLDFGAGAFNTTGARYLEIQVGNSTILSPRQEIISAPFSQKAINAATSDSLSANCVSCVTNAQINSIDGTKVTGTVGNATTAGNVSGIVQIANGGTGSSTKNFVDLTTNQVIAGNKTFTGTISGNFSGGIVSIAPFSGQISSTIAGNSSVYVFAGATATVTVTATQRITGAANAALGRMVASTNNVRVGLCYQSTAAGSPIINFAGNNYQDIQIGTLRQNVGASYSVIPGSAGNYNVGFCVLNGSSAALDNNDYVNGWVMVTN